MQKTLQIVIFDNPCPPDYGGVIDVFYKIKALKALGVRILKKNKSYLIYRLHVFEVRMSKIRHYVTFI